MDSTQTQLEALLAHAAFAPIQNIGWIRITGSDRVRWLNGMVTNSIQALKPGEGCYNFFLNAQGRIQGDATAWLLADEILLQTAVDRIPTLIAYLDHFIIMDDVELTPIPDLQGLLLTGPQAAHILDQRGMIAPAQNTLEHILWAGTKALLLRHDAGTIPRFEFWTADAPTLAALHHVLKYKGTAQATPEILTQFRLLEATPLYGTDIRDKDLPQETNQTRALHFAKGCYLGQEIVERIRSRGQVNRLLTPLTLTGEIPPPGTLLTANEKPAGELTSIAEVPGHGILALGYVRREALDTKAALTYPGGTAQLRTQDS